MYHNNNLISKLDQCRNEQNGKYFFLVFDKNLKWPFLHFLLKTSNFQRHFATLEQILPHYGVKKWHITLHWSTFTQCTGIIVIPKTIERLREWDKLWNKSFFERIKGPFIIIHDVNCKFINIERAGKIKYENTLLAYNDHKWWLFFKLEN